VSTEGTGPYLASDPERTRRMCNHLIHAMEQYLNRHKEVRPVDAFMACHNFHKAAVMYEADRLDLTGLQRLTFYKMAMDTFAGALVREHAAREEAEEAERG
jgi:hypothetical protein